MTDQQQLSDNHTRQYNFIYAELVKNPNDLAGRLAYSIYKERKISYIEQKKEELNRELSEEEITSYHEATLHHCSDYRAQAETILAEHSKKILINLAPELVDKIEKKYATRLEHLVKKFAPTTWKTSKQAVLIGTVTALFIPFFYACLIGMGVVKVMDQNIGAYHINVSLQQNTKQPTPSQYSSHSNPAVQ